MFERLREAIEAALDSATAREDPDEVTRRMHEAVVDARSALEGMREGLVAAERKLAAERQSLEDAQRRGRLAAEIDDEETVQVAKRFALKHAERVGVLQRKVEAQQAELTLAEREVAEMGDQLKAARRNRPITDAADRVNSAWRNLEAAGGARPESNEREDLLRTALDRKAREVAAEEKLRELKKKMGR